MDLILFGMQGSGKGTQGKILAARYDLHIFEMGGALREMIASGTTLGNKIKSTVEAGQLVSDEIIMEVVEAFLAKQSSDQRILFDGIPRTLAQANSLLEILNHHGREVFGMHIQLDETEAIKRLTSRRVCANCKTVYPGFYEEDKCKECGGELQIRSDDSNLDSIKTRIGSFKKETLPVIESFRTREHLIEIEGKQDIENVTAELAERAGHLFI